VMAACQPAGKGWPRLAAIARGAAAQFPVRPADLMPALQGAALGEALRAMERRWIASDFTLDRAALLAGR
jgi:poly(A) polymerase